MANKASFNIPMLIAGICGAIIAYGVGSVLIMPLAGKISNILFVGIFFAQAAFFICMAALICELINPISNGQYWRKRQVSFSLLMLPVLSLIIVFALGCLFQFIYGLITMPTPMIKADDYIIVIDNSGSTLNTDPDNQRFAAVSAFIPKLEKKNNAEVIIFSDTPEIIAKYGPVDSNYSSALTSKLSTLSGDGNTNISDALMLALDACNNPSRKDMVILLSDGDSAVDEKALIKAYTDKNVILNTVGFMYSQISGTRLLTRLSGMTGGTCYSIADMSRLSGVLESIFTNQNKSKMLLDYRYGADRGNILFVIERILFIGFLAFSIRACISLMFNNRFFMTQQKIIEIILSLVAGAAAEIGFYIFAPELVVRLMIIILLGIIVTSRKSFNSTTPMAALR